MSRRRRALATAAFSYGQAALGVLISLFFTRWLLDELGPAVFGLWTAITSLVGYAAFADFGVLGVVSWMIAKADGGKDVDEMRSILSNALALTIAASILYTVIALALAAILPLLIDITTEQRALVQWPLAALVGCTALAFPLRVFLAFRVGIQDVAFVGTLGLVQLLVQAATTGVLTLKGLGVWGIALGACVPPLVTSLAALARTGARSREVLRAWPWPSKIGAKRLLSRGGGALMTSLGWSLMSSSNPLIVASVAGSAAVPVFTTTSRMAFLLMQQAWVLPDAALVGLAQLAGEARERVAGIVEALLRFELLLAGGIACGLLAVNPGFVRLWVGEPLFAGITTNAIIALFVITLTMSHAMGSPTAALQIRPVFIGFVSLLNGVLHVVLAFVLGERFGIAGVAVAIVLGGSLTALPVGFLMTCKITGRTARDILVRVVAPFALRFAPVAAISFGAGIAARRFSLPALALVGAATSALYIVCMRGLLTELPLGPRLSGILRAARLLPAQVPPQTSVTP